MKVFFEKLFYYRIKIYLCIAIQRKGIINTQNFKIMTTIYAVYNKEEKFGTIDNVLTSNADVYKFILKHLKTGTAKLLIDSEHTLMYKITINETQSNLHPIFEQALSPFFK